MSPTADYENLVQQALRVRGSAYAPYSKFRVGAALQTADGQIFTGVNIENAAYSPSLCAERVAVAKAVEAGAKNFVAIAVATATTPPATPCGVCRQVLREFTRELTVICVNPSGERRELWLSDLLPHSFSKRDLDV